MLFLNNGKSSPSLLPRVYEYNPSGLGILKFHEFLLRHPKFRHFPIHISNILLHGLKKAEEIQWEKSRKNIRGPYIRHCIEMILSFVDQYQEKTDFIDILVLAFHDILEEQPNAWKELLELFITEGKISLLGLQVFRDTLVLSTGGFPMKYRAEMIRFFTEKYPNWEQFHESGKRRDKRLVVNIMQLLSPLPPLFKLFNQSQYSHSPNSIEYSQIEQAIMLYVQEVFIIRDKIPIDQIPNHDAYRGLGNYVYMNEADLRRKVQDMLNNMSDMEQMEKIKPGYTETRRIKSYILWVKLKAFGMYDEISLLQKAFLKSNTPMLTYADVENKINFNDEKLGIDIEKLLKSESFSTAY